ncbi:transcriptional regulator [Streptomyces griseorubiginosus]|uniref:transcriptional regulator n=1 Tax=Streptomyces griseorubiginosus TaxID=67304 RepID=UPI00345636E7
MPTPADMPITPEERWGELGLYGARGMTGGEALARILDSAAGRRIPSVTTRRGLIVRLRYLTWGSRGDHWLRTVGIGVTGRTINRWASGIQWPSPSNLRLIDRAFWLCRRASLADHYKQRLWADGRGRRIEIHPVDQKNVQSSRQRDLRVRNINVRHQWPAVVDAWSSNDHSALEELWMRIVDDLGSDHRAYTYVSHLGFGV